MLTIAGEKRNIKKKDAEKKMEGFYFRDVLRKIDANIEIGQAI